LHAILIWASSHGELGFSSSGTRLGSSFGGDSQMSVQTLKISFEGADLLQAGLHAFELRNRILDEIPDGLKISLQRENAASMQFFETILVDVTAAGLVHLLLKIVARY